MTARNDTVTAITASGRLFGYEYGVGSDSFTNFTFCGGQYRKLAIPNAPEAYINGVNPAGTAVVGIYRPSSVSNGGLAGFLYENNSLQTLEFPGAIDSYAWGVNAAGEVVGYFIDRSGFIHGFTWTPPPAHAEKK
jgi:probable HAF family extracellular repeat protein